MTRPYLIAIFLCGTLLSVIALGEEGLVDHTLQSKLPQAAGFAREYPGDAGIEDDRRVIFADNFESGDFAKWDQHSRNESILSLIRDPAADPRMGDNSMKVTATLGENTGGGTTQWFEPSDPVFVRYYVKFAPDCDYTHHMVRIRANKGLTGRDKWSGFGQAGTRPRGDERFVTGIEPWGGNRRYPPPGRWNFYSYWPEMKRSGDGKYWGNHFMPADEPDIPRDQWICVEVMVKHNTPGQRDGEQAFWIDGQLRGHWTGFLWRTSPTLWANSVALESYVTDRWTKNKVNTVYFDNVVIANEYIGPAVETIAASASEDCDARIDDVDELSTGELAVLSGGGSRLAHVIGGLRLMQGLMLGEEIVYLLALIVLFVTAAVAMNSRWSRTTSKGKDYLENAKATIEPNAITIANPEPAMLAMSVAVLGTSAVAGIEDFAPLASLAPSVAC